MSDLTQTHASIEPIGSHGQLAAPLKVSFYPSTDDMAYIVERINKSYKLPPRTQYALQAFLAVNLIGLPLVLWIFDLFLLAFGFFLLNVVFAAVFLPAMIKSDNRRYFRVMFGSIEESVVEVELTDTGVWCRHSGDTSFHAWRNVKLLEETRQSIYFFFEHNGLAVSKSGFAYDDEKDRFLAFAQRHVRNFNTV